MTDPGRLDAIRGQAARNCGLDIYPAELIAVSERLDHRTGFSLARHRRKALEERREELLRDITQPPEEGIRDQS